MEECIEYKGVDLKKYERMIFSMAHRFSNLFGVDREDVISEGYCIFFEAVKKYDENKSSFSTYLYQQLYYLLENYCYDQKGITIKTPSDVDDLAVSVRLVVPYKNFTDTLICAEAKKSLSKKSRKMLKFILSRKWEKPGKGPYKPSLSMMLRYYKNKGWRPIQVMESWAELKDWWKENYCFF